MNNWTDPVKASKATTAAAWGKNRELARKLLMKSKLYRAAAILFAIMGVIMLINFYLSKIDGRFVEAMSNPYTIVMLLIPFLPTFVMSLLAQKAERQFAALKPYEGAAPKDAKSTEPPVKK